ncbi:hypothetical protein HZA56_14145 [Candidatus Poribacteria bacterium]|nr:hypothetical protein [Candidatus Poribacteria bacterium]
MRLARAYDSKVSAQMKKLIIFVVGVVVASSVGFGIGTSRTAPQPQISSASEKSLLEYVNEVRAANNVAPLKEDAVLDQTAKTKGDDMAARNYWEHTTPDGKPFYFIMQQARPGLQGYGENLAECFTSNPDTIEGWKKSPGHMANMINSRFNIFGSYTVWDQDRSCLITVNHFGEE